MADNSTMPPIVVRADPPAGWIDKTMIIHSAPEREGRPTAPTIVVGRDALSSGETFRDYCNRQIETFRANLPQFNREREEPGRLHDRDAFQITFTWAAPTALLRQRVFFIDAGRGMVVSHAATADERDFSEFEPDFQQGLSALRIGG